MFSRMDARLSVGFKLSVLIVCIGLVAGGGIAWSVYRTQAVQIRDDFERRALLIAEIVEATTISRGQPETEQERLTQILELHNDLESLIEREPSVLRVNVYAEHEGQPLIVGSSDGELLGARPSREDEEDLNSVAAGGVLTAEETVDGEPALEILVPLDIEGQPPLAIGAYISTAERDEALAAMQRTLGRTIAIAVVLAVILLYAVVWLLVSQRLQRLANVARHMGEGDYSARVPGSHAVTARDEILRLSAHFNVMAEAIEKLHDETKALASTDPLTGLYNRRFFLETLQREIERSRREGLPLAVMMLDLDGFKAVNDKFGHTAGDAALLHVAEALKKKARAADLTARFGGDEFVILLPNCDAASLQAVMERIRQGIAGLDPPRFGDDVPLQITVSAGGTLLRSDDSLDSLMNRADLALFEAKNAGRNQVRLAA